MIKMQQYIVHILIGMVWITMAHADNKDPDGYSLMTARDIQNKKLSNITITNRTGTPVNVSGLFIASIDINDCSACFGNLIGGDNLGGAVVSPVTFKEGQSIPIGQNFLYNMIYNGIYYVNTNTSSPCALPGCSWPGDDNMTVKGWCITINVVSANSLYTYSHYTNGANPPASAPAYGNSGNSPPNVYDYKYDLIDPSTLGGGNACLGPITCDDKTLTCKVATAQNESFKPYN